LKEAERLGFERAIVPAASAADRDGAKLDVIGVATLRDALTRSGISEG
jgi:predicted ATP-dependent serine protease